jgi:hypothetical protein
VVYKFRRLRAESIASAFRHLTFTTQFVGIEDGLKTENKGEPAKCRSVPSLHRALTRWHRPTLARLAIRERAVRQAYARASGHAAEGSARECEARPEGKGSDRQKSGLSWRTRADIQPDDLNQLQA